MSELTELERAAIDALVAWREMERFTYSGSIGWPEDREKFQASVEKLHTLADRLITAYAAEAVAR